MAAQTYFDRTNSFASDARGHGQPPPPLYQQYPATAPPPPPPPPQNHNHSQGIAHTPQPPTQLQPPYPQPPQPPYPTDWSHIHAQAYPEYNWNHHQQLQPHDAGEHHQNQRLYPVQPLPQQRFQPSHPNGILKPAPGIPSSRPRYATSPSQSQYNPYGHQGQQAVPPQARIQVPYDSDESDESDLEDKDYSLRHHRSYSAPTRPDHIYTHRSRQHHRHHDTRDASTSPSPSRSRSRVSDRDRRHSPSRHHSSTRDPAHRDKPRDRPHPHDHSSRNTFLGAFGGGALGDAILPGLGTLGGALLGSVYGNKAGRRSNSERPSNARRRSTTRDKTSMWARHRRDSYDREYEEGRRRRGEI